MMRLWMQEVKRVMEKTLSDLQIPMDIADECMLQREKRTDIDQVHDEAEKCLTKVSRSKRFDSSLFTVRRT